MNGKLLIETERLTITEFTVDMAKIVQKNSVDEDNKRFVSDEVWETAEEAEEALEYLISRYGAFEGPLVYPVIVRETQDNIGYVQMCPIDHGNWEAGYHIAKSIRETVMPASFSYFARNTRLRAINKRL